MVVTLLGEIAKVSVVTTFLATLSCIIAAVLAVQFSTGPEQPVEEAFWLAKSMALLGGAAVITFVATGTLYFWLTGEASDRAFGVIEIATIGIAFVFTLTATALLAAHARKAS
jgi:hypothetical protein